jgi:putative membrane protein
MRGETRQPWNWQTFAVAAATLLLVASLVGPRFPREQWLQHLPTIPALVLLFVAARRQWFSMPAHACLVAMTALHIVGARWIYSFVPYEEWCDAVLGSGPREWFGWSRNHYDRLVHLLFGLLTPLPIAEASLRWGRLPRGWSLAWAAAAVMAISAGYEIFEWLLAVIASPETADRYNGQQGDAWDAQKDMALALLGCMIAVAWLWRFGKRVLPPRSA